MDKPIILYLDDEKENVILLKAIAESWKDWDLVTFTDSKEATDAIDGGLCPAVAISDQNMPGMDGLSFLSLVKAYSEHSRRILLTGVTDEELVIKAVRDAKIHDFIRKPIDERTVTDRLHSHIWPWKHAKMLQDAIDKEYSKLSNELKKLNGNSIALEVLGELGNLVLKKKQK